MQSRLFSVVLGLLVFQLSIVGVATGAEPHAARIAVPGQVSAPDFDGAVGWLNTDKPITMKSLRGKVVLLDFWTFCCINCMHILPDLHKLEEKYKNNLVVIGVHSAKFENEKDTDNIRRAIQRYDIHHPVANDANFKLWDAYGVKSWPTLVLISPEGNILSQASGEGHFADLDRVIGHVIDVFGKEGKLKEKPIHFALEKEKLKQSELLFPGKISADAAGKRLFISDTGHHRIVATDTSGKVLVIIGSGQQGLKDGAFEAAQFHHPQGTAYDAFNDRLYVADTENHALRLIDFKTRKVTTICGDGTQASATHGHFSGIAGATVHLDSPWDLNLINGKVYIAMAGTHQLWMYNPDSHEISSYAGDGQEGIKDGQLAGAMLAQPSGLTNDGKKIYFADSEASAVRSADIAPAWNSAGAQIQTYIGHGLFDFGDKDGNSVLARLQHPLGVLYKDGRVYIADSYNHKIKVLSLSDRSATTLAGTGKPGLVDGVAPQFSEPAGLVAIGDILYIADTNNHRIRALNLKTHQTRSLTLLH